MSDTDDVGDVDQPGEELDEEATGENFPPDRPRAVDDLGITSAEELGGESLADRESRTRPEVWEPQVPADFTGTVIESGALPTDRDIEAEVPVSQHTDMGPLAPDDFVSGDETTRDVASEMAPEPAEEDAVRAEDDEELEAEERLAE